MRTDVEVIQSVGMTGMVTLDIEKAAVLLIRPACIMGVHLILHPRSDKITFPSAMVRAPHRVPAFLLFSSKMAASVANRSADAPIEAFAFHVVVGINFGDSYASILVLNKVRFARIYIIH